MERGQGGALRAALRDWEATIAGLALVIVFGAVVWGVIARYIAPQPANWSNEVATLGFAWIVFVGAAAGARRGLHIGVDLITAQLPERIQRIIAICMTVFLAVALAYVTWLALDLGMQSYSRPTPVLRLPSAIVHVAAVIGFGSMAVTSLARAWTLALADKERST